MAKLTKAEKVYDALEDYETFDSFWYWYRTKVCGIAMAKPGSKPEAAVEWGRLEESDFLGVGIDGFRQGCAFALKLAIAGSGIGTQHACRFLSGGRHGEPEWYRLLLESYETKASKPTDFLAPLRTQAPPEPRVPTPSTPEKTAAFMRAVPFSELAKRYSNDVSS